ncbi:hypothetical protein ACTD5D_34335 [Nocardia takedensis]|uniref:hypothetical protein n=1 Tax=Nocardia takedensis TaxID=259390 RepID=UPI0012F701CC|nr:hypothetical protein [Nocardia takedensis]
MAEQPPVPDTQQPNIAGAEAIMGSSWLDSDIGSSGAARAESIDRVGSEGRFALRAAAERTAQDEYYGCLGFLRSLPNDERMAAFAARLEQAGPPAPVWHDSARGWLNWHIRYVPTVEEFAQLLERLATEGLLTSVEAASYTGTSAAEAVAEIAAKVQAIDAISRAHDRGQVS